MFSMRAAQQSGDAAGTIREVPVDLFIRDVRNNTYLGACRSTSILLDFAIQTVSDRRSGASAPPKRGYSDRLLALRAGEDSVLLTECEAEALAVAIKKLSVFAAALDNARNFAGKARAEGGGVRT
jgi:hypothetical protein